MTEYGMSDDYTGDEAIVCNACQCPINSAAQRTIHYKSDWHRYNVKRRCAGLGAISERLFTQKVISLKQSVAKDAVATCQLCGIPFKHEKALKHHMTTKKHLKKAQSARNREMRGKKAQEREAKKAQEREAGKVEEQAQATTSEEEVLVEKMQELKVDEPSADKSEEKSETDGFDPPIELKHCLFCHSSFGSIEASLQHMLHVHGFFVPFIEYLQDLEGLLSYLGAKVGMGHVCLWCNKSKGSLQAIRSHMDAKSHCKMNTDEDTEILDFYYFPGRRQDNEAESKTENKEEDNMEETGDADDQEAGVPINEKEEQKEEEKETKEVLNCRGQVIVFPKRKRHLTGMNDEGELLLSDGSVIGHRKYSRYYRQHHKAAETRDSVLINQMRQQYRALALDGFRTRHGGVHDGGRSRKAIQLAQKQRLRTEFRANAQKYWKDVNMMGF